MGEQASELRVEELELLRRLRQYIALRWLAVVAIVVSALLATTAFGVRVPLVPVLGLSAIIAAYNLVFATWQRRGEWEELAPEAAGRRGRRFAFAQIVADLVVLTALLHFTGGIETPFSLYYLVHVGFASILLSRRDTYLITAMAILLFGGLVGLEGLGWVPHVHLEGFAPAALYRQPSYIAAVLVALATTLVVVSAVSTGIVAELRRRREEWAYTKEQQLAEVSRQLSELDRMRTFFLALASHDLKTPLSVAINNIQVLLGGFAGHITDQQRHWLERANARLMELVWLINEFLDVSQLDPARITAEMEEVSLADIAWAAVESVRDRAKEKRIELQIEIPAELSGLTAAPRRLQQVFVNLLDNGIKFSPKEGCVTLQVCEDEDCFRVAILDTGPGIPSRYMPHIFEDYFRVRRAEFVPGAGLGLCTAKKIVEAHGGEIWVESPYREGQSGSKFTFTLPKGRDDGEE